MARRPNDGITYIPVKSAGLYKRTISIVWRKNGLYAQKIGGMAAHLADAASR